MTLIQHCMGQKYRKNNVRELELVKQIDALLKSIRLNK